MALAVGLGLALGVGLMATVSGLDRDRALYPTALIVIGSLYCLFAVMGGSTRALVLETLIAGVFIGAALVGFRRSLWIAVAGMAAHGVFDMVHGRILDNPGVPDFWPGFCGGYDVMAALYLAWRLRSGGIRA